MPFKRIINIIKYSYLIFFCISISYSFAQKGRISLYLDDNPFRDTIPVEVRLYSENADLIYKNKLFIPDDRMRIDSVLPGKYDLIIYLSGKPAMTFHKIKVAADSIIYLHAVLSDLNFKPESINRQKNIINKKGETEADFALFGQAYLSDQTIVKSIGALGLKGSPKYYVSNFYAIGANIGSSIAFCDLQQNKIQAFADTFSMERFFYWKLSVAYNNRFVFIKAKERSAFRPCFLDLSIGYNLPLAYRYVGIKKETKSVVRHIANFNDFSAMARLGFGVMAITAEYRLTNSIKPQYGTVPNLMLGIEIIIPN